jgi:hypothetical protein
MIDDIRLMNNNGDKFQGFPVSIDQIITKIYEINPKYKIRYFKDEIVENDVLMAYIDEEKQCVHKYLTHCSTNPQPPGFADFLRGTIALYYFSKKYDYTLLIDRSHPVFKYFKQHKHIFCNTDLKTEELLPPLSYEDIFLKLNEMFTRGKSFSVLTNSFYDSNNGSLNNFGEITKDCAEYMKELLSPSIEVETRINDVFSKIYKINTNDSFKVIHLRFGDKFIHNNLYDNELYNFYYNKISNLVNIDKTIKYVLISDSSLMANKLKTDINELLYWDNSKIHLGDLINVSTSNMLDTVVDFFIISRSNEIISNDSGFSRVSSVIYNIKYTLIY